MCQSWSRTPELGSLQCESLPQVAGSIKKALNPSILARSRLHEQGKLARSTADAALRNGCINTRKPADLGYEGYAKAML